MTRIVLVIGTRQCEMSNYARERAAGKNTLVLVRSPQAAYEWRRRGMQAVTQIRPYDPSKGVECVIWETNNHDIFDRGSVITWCNVGRVSELIVLVQSELELSYFRDAVDEIVRLDCETASVADSAVDDRAERHDSAECTALMHEIRYLRKALDREFAAKQRSERTSNAILTGFMDVIRKHLESADSISALGSL